MTEKSKQPKPTHELLVCICECHDAGHQLVFEKWHYDGDFHSPEISAYITLNQIRGFWKRLRYAVRYVFRRDQQMAFDSVLLKKQDVDNILVFFARAVLERPENGPNASRE